MPMNLTLYPSPILRKKSENVVLPLTKKDILLCEEMIKHIEESHEENAEEKGVKPGVGLAAPQVGFNKNIFYIHALPNKEINTAEFRELMINPIVISKSIGTIALKNGEGCLSIDDEGDHTIQTNGYVKRHFKIIIEGYSYFSKKNVQITKSGYHAIIIQHEMDHLNGKLFIDHLNNKDPWFKDEKMKII